MKTFKTISRGERQRLAKFEIFRESINQICGILFSGKILKQHTKDKEDYETVVIVVLLLLLVLGGGLNVQRVNKNR